MFLTAPESVVVHEGVEAGGRDERRGERRGERRDEVSFDEGTSLLP